METAPPQRTSTRRRWWWLAGVLVLAVVGATVAVLVVGDDEPATVRVTFEVSGAGATPRSLMWRTPEMSSLVEESVPVLPWSRTVEISAREGVLSVQANGDMTDLSLPGPFVCRILVDGRLVEQVGPSLFSRCWTTMQRVLADQAS